VELRTKEKNNQKYIKNTLNNYCRKQITYAKIKVKKLKAGLAVF